MANAVTDLALLNSGQVIPAEFWPDHFTKSMDEDRHRPWWELVPNPKSDLTEEEMDMQLSEYYGELLRREEENRPHLSSDILRQKDGIYVLPCRRPDARSITVATTTCFVPYVCEIENVRPAEGNDELHSVDLQVGSKISILRLPKRQETRKQERYFDSHGWRGRTRLKYSPVTVNGV
jgi:hypothetical protein